MSGKIGGLSGPSRWSCWSIDRHFKPVQLFFDGMKRIVSKGIARPQVENGFLRHTQRETMKLCRRRASTRTAIFTGA